MRTSLFNVVFLWFHIFKITAEGIPTHKLFLPIYVAGVPPQMGTQVARRRAPLSAPSGVRMIRRLSPVIGGLDGFTRLDTPRVLVADCLTRAYTETHADIQTCDVSCSLDRVCAITK